MWVHGERDKRLDRGTEQDIVEVLLTLTDDRSQFVGHGEDQKKVGDWQEFLPAFCQPGFSVLMVAFGATTIAAGVVDVVFLTTVFARQQVSTQRLRPAVDEIVHGTTMAGQESLAELF